MPTPRLEIETGRRFGNLLVVGEGRHRGRRAMECLCDCGTRKMLAPSDLANGNVASCGCRRRGRPPMRLKPGTRFGQLEVVGLAERLGRPRTTCRCSCGAMTEVLTFCLLDGSTKSCGCLRRRHGHSWPPSPTYKTWQGMIDRCTNQRSRDWVNYGGRGITICERWLKFEAFLGDMGERPEWATGGLDRLDNDRGYEPNNCAWATRSQQANNRRKPRRLTWSRALSSELRPRINLIIL